MLKKIIKRDGSIEDFDPSKLNKWSIWAAKDLKDRVDWSSIVLHTVKSFAEVADSRELQKQLIKNCNQAKKWGYAIMAGRLYISMYRKELYGDRIPTVKELVDKLTNAGLMSVLNYSDDDYKVIETIINHDLDFKMAYFQIKQIRKKYALSNKVTGDEYETPQFTYMRMALALAEDEPLEVRLAEVKNWYDHFSNNRINPPTPNYNNLGTKHNGYASCCLYKTDDNAKSLAIGDHIAYTMTYMSAGIGGLLHTRSLQDPVKSGSIEHQGKLPYFNSLAKAVKANIQGGRGGACTTYFSCFDPEAKTIALLQNPKTTTAAQNRDIHFAVLFNKLFVKKVARNEKIFTFNIYTAPDLDKLFFSSDDVGFEELYNKYEEDPNFTKNYVDARDLAIVFGQQSHEVATLYYAQIDEMNRHTPFKDTIYSSNLCLEAIMPTQAYQDMRDLYTDGYIGEVKFIGRDQFLYTISANDVINYTDNEGKSFKQKPAYEIEVGDTLQYQGGFNKVISILYKTQQPEVALCSLAGIPIYNIKTDEEYESATYYALKMIDKCIHKSHYELPHVGFTAKKRLNAGIGILGLAYHLAKRSLKYDTPEGLAEIHKVAERHMFFLIKASLRLGKELGNAAWMNRTKWPEGWLPIDTYKKSVDELVAPIYKYPWEELRAEIIDNKGIRNSTLCNYMPSESSSKASGAPNSIYPIRDLSLKKTDAKNVLDWVAIDNDIYEQEYQLAWEITNTDMTKMYAVVQKFTDQGISADKYRDRSENKYLTTEEIVEEFINMVKYGMKTKYYQNTFSVNVDGTESKIVSVVDNKVECVGACQI